ncbi:MAG: WYL domain-containing protein [Oleibacter sp.]|nr:WYL domain-containing protein [Thalassolituus sp.]
MQDTTTNPSSEQIPSDHLQQLHRLFKKHPNGLSIMALGAELGLSPNQLQPLLTQLIEQYSAPLKYQAQNRTYAYASDQPFELPGLAFTATELRSLVTVLNLIQDLNEGSDQGPLHDLQQQIENIMASKGLSAEHLHRHIRILSSAKQPINNHNYQRISDALFLRKQLDIRYVASDQTLSERRISPQTLVYYREQWYLDAWCHKRQQLRTFMLSRINSAIVTEKDAQEFAAQQLEEHFHNSYGIFSGEQQYIASLTFLPGAAHLVAQQLWHPQAQGQWQGDQYQLSLPYNDPRELLRDLLSYAPYVMVNEPPSLKQTYQQRLQEALNKNR